MLIGPLDVLDKDSLVIVPWGPLANVPFGTLHDGTCYLVERVAITVAPSRLAAHHAAGRRREATRRLILGIADEHTPRVHDEIRAVASIGNESTVLADEEATVEALWEHAPNHDIIHIASHGIERADNPLFGAIKFTDRWLTAAEIAGASLDGQLVVLSACASGRQHGAGSGDELIGLPRALLAAGASSVVVNLWQVDDLVASTAMTLFHRNLQDLNPPEALRAAQVELMVDKPHPYHWGPSVVIGAPNTPRGTS